jgi:hypothetical protein
VYPLLQDETCFLIAVDFDKAGWHEDAKAYLDVCRENNIDALLERSRSGNGGHVWIFFEIATPAVAARKLGAAILTKAMEKRHLISFDSYDRFFPNQDTLPKGGFGNLIALPLQKDAKLRGNSTFIDDYFEPVPDPWQVLSKIRKLKRTYVEAVITKLAEDGNVTGVRRSAEAEYADDDPWLLPPSGKKEEQIVPGTLPKKIDVVLANRVYVPKIGLPPIALNRLKRLAAFQNPEFYRNQAMRLPTYEKPRIISCADDFEKYLGIPRGLLDEVGSFFKVHDVDCAVKDERFEGRPHKIAFNGKLRPLQKEAVKILQRHEDGILSTSTAFGKTVVAIWMLVKRGRNALILVHRQQLMDQWKEQLQLFTNLKAKEIGCIGGGHKSTTGIVDIGIIQSLYRKGEVKDLVADYGHVIVDECHHVSAFSVEQIMKQAKAKYILGLTATPLRKDGHHPIIIMQCGPIRFKTNPKEQTKEHPFEHKVFPKTTEFKLVNEAKDAKIQEIYALLAKNEPRNHLIASDIVQAMRNGRTPILLTERKEHLEIMQNLLQEKVANIFVLRGGYGKKQRKAILETLRSIPDNQPRLIIATGRYIGEGFDDARLDTLFLALPISWHGTLQQYAGRLHRLQDGKQEVQIYDYVDNGVPMLQKMYDRRLKGYKRIGYQVTHPDQNHP